MRVRPGGGGGARGAGGHPGQPSRHVHGDQDGLLLHGAEHPAGHGEMAAEARPLPAGGPAAPAGRPGGKGGPGAVRPAAGGDAEGAGGGGLKMRPGRDSTAGRLPFGGDSGTLEAR